MGYFQNERRHMHFLRKRWLSMLARKLLGNCIIFPSQLIIMNDVRSFSISNHFSHETVCQLFTLIELINFGLRHFALQEKTNKKLAF